MYFDNKNFVIIFGNKFVVNEEQFRQSGER